MRGAKQKPNSLLAAGGSKHLRLLEPVMKAPIGDAPEHFRGVAMETWVWAVERLTEAGTIYDADRVALETLCLAVHRQQEAQDFINDMGVIYEDPVKGWTKNPACTVITAENNIIARLLAEFGLTPASRGKVQGPTEKKKSRFEGF
ncbi:phage terminase small subunit P27 family [Luteolibacter yonseiensis]|uniref:Phage terminase small subunit P27 family n=1 Tax=Luteolibacter yonseiensis TaxID=1144680 RepID=A0A934R439_9BACT|nr:phage terminase small subunit P27 family [Luteolibacter yonseiensis]MBK1816522.1 phage terminase small subunit P27 family [Luteolibacter yonseiensis]